MSSSSGSSSDSDASSGSSSSSSSDDPSSHELDQVETKQRLTLKQSKEARLSNLPPFKVPGQTDHHHHHHHHHHHKKKHHVALTKAEIEAVCSTFATFAKFTGVRLRRHDLAEQTNVGLICSLTLTQLLMTRTNFYILLLCFAIN